MTGREKTPSHVMDSRPGNRISDCPGPRTASIGRAPSRFSAWEVPDNRWRDFRDDGHWKSATRIRTPLTLHTSDFTPTSRHPESRNRRTTHPEPIRPPRQTSLSDCSTPLKPATIVRICPPTVVRQTKNTRWSAHAAGLSCSGRMVAWDQRRPKPRTMRCSDPTRIRRGGAASMEKGALPCPT